MKQVEGGNFDVEKGIDPGRGDEFGLLAAGFLEMTGRLKEYIRTSLLAKIRQREAELAALRSAIRPHFLYNSLEIIRMNAVANDDESTASLALMLADQMRYSLGAVRGKVTLGRELDMIRNYFAVIGLRYGGAVTWEIQVSPPDLERAQVLSLMIQPVVENAVVHGIKPKGRGHVEIRAAAQGADLAVIITDDGVGMDEARLAEIAACIERDDFAGDGYGKKFLGLKNVHDRLRYVFGEGYGLAVTGAAGAGTRVTLRLPLSLEETEASDTGGGEGK
jgi:two-component system sensor histidine kinase YesM